MSMKHHSDVTTCCSGLGKAYFLILREKCLILSLIKNSSKIKKWWPKFNKNVKLKKLQQHKNKNNKATAMRIQT